MFNDLAQANVDHYNEHPVEHAILIAATAVVGIVAVRAYFNKFLIIK